MRSYYLDMFVKLFVAWVCCAVIGVISVSHAIVDGTDDLVPLAIVCIIAALIISYVMFYMLCKDLIDKKGYGDGEIPLLLIAFVTGPFVFFYMLALPSKKENTIVASLDNSAVTYQTSAGAVQTSAGVNQDDSWVCTCGGRNSSQTNICKKCGRTSDGKMTANVINTPKNTKASLLNVWYCPKCGDVNAKSTRICKGCGYEK